MKHVTSHYQILDKYKIVDVTSRRISNLRLRPRCNIVIFDFIGILRYTGKLAIIRRRIHFYIVSIMSFLQRDKRGPGGSMS